MNKTPTSRPTRKVSPPTAIKTLGALLAQGVIRLHERQKPLAEPTEERVHTRELATRRHSQ